MISLMEEILGLIPLPHEHLPPPFGTLVAQYLLLENVQYADLILLTVNLLLLTLAFVQIRAFARPPPVPLKKLPRRPRIALLFQPDDVTASHATKSAATSTTKPLSTAPQNDYPFESSKESPWKRRLASTLSVTKVTQQIFRVTTSSTFTPSKQEEADTKSAPPKNESESQVHRLHSQLSSGGSGGDDWEDMDDTDSDNTDDEVPVVPPSFIKQFDLPDSFAPLLSSSQMQVLKDQLTADLIHAVHFQGGIRLRPGRHEIPLDKDSSRPQLLLDVQQQGCRVSAVALVGSDGFSTEQDLNVDSTLRSTPMVKNAGLVFDPPLPLSNVAPTLIHFPTLFQDNLVPTLRRIQIVRFFMDFVISMSSFLERCLWILESKCQIHLSKIRIAPIYKGSENKSPEWRLSLAFSGHLLLFGWIPFPFINVTLPTFIIPQPHALLQYLLTAQPLASAKLRRENIAERLIALALLGTAESWTSNLKVVVTPPAVGVDVTLAGGVAVAVEMGLGRDPHSGKVHEVMATNPKQPESVSGRSLNSMSSWTTNAEPSGSVPRPPTSSGSLAPPFRFDANDMVPWKVELSAKGSVSHEKISMHILKFTAEHEDLENGVPVKSRISSRGSLAVWKLRPDESHMSDGTPVRRRVPSFGHRKNASFGHFSLGTTDDTPSVAAVLIFPEETESFHRDLRMLQYDYAFDVFDDSKLDAITVTVAATHPMLNGGTIVTTILDSIYAFGSVAAREDAIVDPEERKRKRNILRHLPATDFTFGVQNVFIPPESLSYSDDGQTLFVPDATGGRMMVRLLGGFDAHEESSLGSHAEPADLVSDGIKVVADFDVPSLILRTQGKVKEFPELDIFEGVKVLTYLSGVISGSVRAHLRPQKVAPPTSSKGRNIFNPLEAYEIDFRKSSMSVRVKELNTTLGHRRIIFPSESTFFVKIIESVVDMGFEGKTQCELGWDFQGLSPILQVTTPGKSPADATPEDKEQVSLLVAPLRQGRVSLNVSSVGGISIRKAATSREDKEGLYDWKFFNALVSPDGDSAGRIMDVLHDKRTMDKLLRIVKLVNKDLHKILEYALRQVWRAKEIFDQEGISDPGHVIPMFKMARLISLFITGETDLVDEVLPIIERVVNGDGLDIVKVKDLLRQHLEKYDDWAPELDRAVRWAAVVLGPMSVVQPYMEEHVTPLAQLPHYATQFQDIPSAANLYDRLLDKPQLPLEPSFSNLVSIVAPYLSFQQIEYILEARVSSDWQEADLRRIRYVYSIKRKVLEIAESYGGLSFLPQSFLVSVFLGEATRTSLRASATAKTRKKKAAVYSMSSSRPSRRRPFLRRRRGHTLENRRLRQVVEGSGNDDEEEDFGMTPAERVVSLRELDQALHPETPSNLVLDITKKPEAVQNAYELGDSLLGPQDVAILLQAGLTSVMKASTVVQLNQRMLLDLICSQPRTFAVAVLAEIGSPSGQGSPRGLTSALMSLLELDQSAFKSNHQIDMHALLESWLPGLKIPRREDHLAGGRWARQSYYEALYSVATRILDDAETYAALKGHVQRVQPYSELDPIPQPKEEPIADIGLDLGSKDDVEAESRGGSRLKQSIEAAQELIRQADEVGRKLLERLFRDEKGAKTSDEYRKAIHLYNEAFAACSKVLSLDKHAFQATWFRDFYRRNYDALMLKSMFDNVVDNVDNVRYWLHKLLAGAKRSSMERSRSLQERVLSSSSIKELSESSDDFSANVPMPTMTVRREVEIPEDVFLNPASYEEQVCVDAILEATIYESATREQLRYDPLVRLLIPNPPGSYNFTIVSAMGVVTEGKKGLELKDAFARLEKQRGVQAIRADTATARSFEYNAGKIVEAIEAAVQIGKPYGYLGYSQGCSNALMAESMLLSGTPKQRTLLFQHDGLVCRQLLFSAANGSFHGVAMEKKVQRLIVMCEEFFKYQQGYVSRALSSSVLETLNSILDSAHFHKLAGGAQSFLPEGCRAFWREAQHLARVPTCTLRGVMEEHTTPECLEMISHLLTKQSGSPLHDSQVHVYDAVGHPVYHHNRNGRLLRRCDVGEGAIQRTHHWSPLSDEVEFVRTTKDVDMASFDCAKDRHVFPWLDVNARFGFIKYLPDEELKRESQKEWHPIKLVEQVKEENGSWTPPPVSMY